MSYVGVRRECVIYIFGDYIVWSTLYSSLTSTLEERHNSFKPEEISVDVHGHDLLCGAKILI